MNADIASGNEKVCRIDANLSCSVQRWSQSKRCDNASTNFVAGPLEAAKEVRMDQIVMLCAIPVSQQDKNPDEGQNQREVKPGRKVLTESRT